MTATWVWITGATRNGKTQHLIDWLSRQSANVECPWLVFAANGDNRMALAQRLAAVIQDRVPYTTTTPAGFIQSEVILFWPLLVDVMALKAQFPLKLRPENEQLLALQLWEPLLDQSLQVEGWSESKTVRRALDLLQLAASAGIPTEEITQRLRAGMMPNLVPMDTWNVMGTALLQWRAWCLERGFLTYGLMTELYWRYLLPLPQYQAQLLDRFSGTVADDVDEYSAIAPFLFQVFKTADRPQAFTYNPNGQIRLGVGADPAATLALAQGCERIQLPHTNSDSLGHAIADDIVQWVQDPLAIPELPEPIQLITATTRGKMLRQTADLIADAIHREAVAPSDIAIIGPGLDAIARYSLIEILSRRGIIVASLKDQRPLISSPFVRALLTLLALVYPGLGRLVNRDAVAEMLVVLSQTPENEASLPWFDLTHIDPVRSELIADHCFVPDIDHPRLLPVENFPRWDRLGHQATAAYNRILAWLSEQKKQQQQRYPVSPVITLDRAVQDFLWRGNYLPTDQLSALRELMETAQYFWDVEQRLALYGGIPREDTLSDVGRFIRLLQRGTVSANPYPARALDGERQGVTLATVFQYRAQRLTHRWQFWLDAGSPRWLTGRDELFGAEIFLSSWPERPVTAADTETMHEARLERILRDLLGRTTERLYLCHSELALNGQEQVGPLLGLVSAIEPLETTGTSEVPGR
ncbi:hypothetical protein N836_27695 [Leptolyngbya sp. Heron Island J]|uniref:hypothetical protein n=1 Tax=Leptolyngbya sp. Heron Island J TaxID=1385935 RepID=UPI0003B9D21F|nr:hypothetical protein [Leptolyngbya sp. Heron Island J]ESA32378.1 hypothetical protein N836_27695 [Leptolyngbya sp. Heron Island J]